VIGDDQIELAVAIKVGELGAHARPRLAVARNCDP
jgi:hypothetical protein